MAADELNRANETWPQFHSKHEAIGVLDEELFEKSEEADRVSMYSRELHAAVYKDYDLDKPIRRMEINLAAELAEGIQVLAMLKKFRCLIESEKNDEV